MMLRAIYFYNFSCRAISPPLGTTYYSNQFKHTVTLNIIYKLTFCQIIYIKIFADSMVMMLLKFHYMYYRSDYVYRFKRNYIFCKYLNYFKFQYSTVTIAVIAQDTVAIAVHYHQFNYSLNFFFVIKFFIIIILYLISSCQMSFLMTIFIL